MLRKFTYSVKKNIDTHITDVLNVPVIIVWRQTSLSQTKDESYIINKYLPGKAGSTYVAKIA